MDHNPTGYELQLAGLTRIHTASKTEHAYSRNDLELAGLTDIDLDKVWPFETALNEFPKFLQLPGDLRNIIYNMWAAEIGRRKGPQRIDRIYPPSPKLSTDRIVREATGFLLPNTDVRIDFTGKTRLYEYDYFNAIENGDPEKVLPFLRNFVIDARPIYCAVMFGKKSMSDMRAFIERAGYLFRCDETYGVGTRPSSVWASVETVPLIDGVSFPLQTYDGLASAQFADWFYNKTKSVMEGNSEPSFSTSELTEVLQPLQGLAGKELELDGLVELIPNRQKFADPKKPHSIDNE